MRPSTSSVELFQQDAERELLGHLARMTPRVSASRPSQFGFTSLPPDLTSMSSPARVDSVSSSADDPLRLLDPAAAVGGCMSPPLLTLTASLVRQGVGNIVDDSFNRCFEETFPVPWNWNVYLLPAWLLGIVFRYVILFPLRALALFLGFIVFFCTFALIKSLGWALPSRRRAALEQRLIQTLCSVFVMSWSGVVRFHGVRPVAKRGEPPGIFVANHSSMIDFIILQQSHNYSVVGQKHPGWVGFFQDQVLGSLMPIWFDRSDSENKSVVAHKLEEHARDSQRPPILVFPEGTCVNNKYVIMFRKTVFDLDTQINPVAIKYNEIFVPGYWNSRRVSFAGHLMRLMTSWAVVCDVWYMEPMRRRSGESAIDFAKRVQHAIAKRAGIKAVDWDGYMKYWSPSQRFIRDRRRQCSEYLLAEHGLRASPTALPGSASASLLQATSHSGAAITALATAAAAAAAAAAMATSPAPMIAATPDHSSAEPVSRPESEGALLEGAAGSASGSGADHPGSIFNLLRAGVPQSTRSFSDGSSSRGSAASPRSPAASGDDAAELRRRAVTKAPANEDVGLALDA